MLYRPAGNRDSGAGQPRQERGATPAPQVKRIVCLANSRMYQGRCIAGREFRTDGTPVPWIRPVTGRENEGVSEEMCRYVSGHTPRLLDIMDVPVIGPQPKEHQQENWLLDESRNWNRVGRAALVDLPKWVDPVD